jgi:hypothetical protein
MENRQLAGVPIGRIAQHIATASSLHRLLENGERDA